MAAAAMMIGLAASVFTRLLTMIGGSCLMIRVRVTEGTSTRIIRHEPAGICSRLTKGAAALLTMVAASL